MKKQNQEYYAEYYKKNKDKKLAQGRVWHNLNRDKVSASKKEWYSKNKERIKNRVENSRLLREYGLTKIQVEELKAAQGHKCAVCFQATKLYVDHNHTTGQIRDMLCSNCNSGLGMLKESVQILQNLIAYINKHSKEST